MSSNALNVDNGNAPIEADDSSAVAPFRRNVDDEKESGPGPNADEAIEQYLSDTETKSPAVRFGPGHPSKPVHRIPHHTRTMRVIHQALHHLMVRIVQSRSRVSSFATDVDALTPPFLRSRVPSLDRGLIALLEYLLALMESPNLLAVLSEGE